MLPTTQILIDSDRRPFTVADAVNNQSGPEHTITAGEDSGCGCHERLRIHRDQSARRDFHLVIRREEIETWRLSDGHDDGVALDLAFAILEKCRIETLVLIEDPLGLQSLERGHPAVFANDALRPESRMNNDP